jgi:hypothetical protein
MGSKQNIYNINTSPLKQKIDYFFALGTPNNITHLTLNDTLMGSSLPQVLTVYATTAQEFLGISCSMSLRLSTCDNNS